MKEIIDGLPNICGQEDEIIKVTRSSGPVFLGDTNISLDRVNTAFGVALHMHQPTIPAGGDDLATAELISNLDYMMRHPDMGDNHDAPVFAWCYSRMGDFIPELIDKGKNPRVMLDYSGNILWGLRQMGRGDILDNLKKITCDPFYRRHVEWLGTMWGHAVVASTPVPDLLLHIRAWQHYFASVFGLEALGRVKGFSPPEMNLPNHPDLCYAYVTALKECGYKWILAQEHSVENLDGRSLSRQHLPHLLIARNSKGEEVSITALIKTQGSDTKLVAQMQPYYEALSLQPMMLEGKRIPPYVLQIGDGENGGVMMNEFPDGYKNAFDQIGRQGTVALNGTEFLELIEESGFSEKDYIPIYPWGQHRIWEKVTTFSEGAVQDAINAAKKEDDRFHMEGGSWTSNLSWVRGYENVLDPMNRLSAAFHERFDNVDMDTNKHGFRNALLHLLLSQTSCFRYWGQGIWTDHAREICRRGMEILANR
ncbi:MAG: glycosyl hydrolase family 57 [Desulfobacterales bacterium C00003104]|nr:MAG: glycosyl hydrolase family 57 [Desulfobacterales bacterium C00003104]